MTNKSKRKTAPQTFWQKYRMLFVAAGCLTIPYLSMYIHMIFNSTIYLSPALSVIQKSLVLLMGFGSCIFIWLTFAIRGELFWERAGAKSVFAYLIIMLLSFPGFFILVIGTGFTTHSVNEMSSRIIVDNRIYYIVDSYGMMTDFYKDVYECLPGEQICLHVDDVAWDERELTPEEIVQTFLDRTGR